MLNFDISVFGSEVQFGQTFCVPCPYHLYFITEHRPFTQRKHLGRFTVIHFRWKPAWHPSIGSVLKLLLALCSLSHESRSMHAVGLFRWAVPCTSKD